MALFHIGGQSARKLDIETVLLERDIQQLFERNLNVILEIDFLASEYSTSSGGRIDSLGIDRTGSPCIIEYKRNQNDNVINQGLSYLKWLIDHKAEFENLCKARKISLPVEWSSPRVICVAESYSPFDLDTVDILPINIELFEYRRYSENLLFVELKSRKRVSSGSKIGPKKKNLPLSIRSYAIEDHLAKGSAFSQSLFKELRELILGMDESILEEPKKLYVAYKLTTNFVDVQIQKNAIKLYLNVSSGKLVDPRVIAQDLAKPKRVGHWGNGDYVIKLVNKPDFEYLEGLLRQSYSLNK